MPMPFTLVLLAGCPATDEAPVVDPSTPPPGECTDLQEVPSLAACAAPVGGWAAGEAPAPGGTFAISLTGRVEESGTGDVPDGCFDNDYLGTLGDDSRWWYRAADATGAVWTIGIAGLPRSVQTGDAVNTSFIWDGEAQFLNEDGVIAVRDGEGTLLAWIGLGGALGEIQTPADFVLAEGEAVCAVEPSTGSCPANVAFDVTVDGAPVSYGDTTTAGPWTVVHAGYTRAWDTEVEGCTWYAPPKHWLIGVSSL